MCVHMQQFTNGCKLSHSPIITITFLSSVHFKFIKLRLMYSIEEVFVGAKKGGGGWRRRESPSVPPPPLHQTQN